MHTNHLYLDHAATTPMRQEVLNEMMPYLTEMYGNPSSLHAFGREARIAISRSRDSIAHILHCSPSELMFTGGGTESDNTAILGAAQQDSGRKKHIITTSVEHHAVLHPCAFLASQGWDVTIVPVDHTGRVHPEHVIEAIREDTCLISVMYGNNEVGTLQPIEEIGHAARERRVLFHVDAVQALGHAPLDLSALPVDLMSFSAHKLHGPKGIGLLYIAKHAAISSLIHGGSQERKRRAGTEYVAGIVGFAKAVELAHESLEANIAHLETLRQTMIDTLQEQLGADGFVVNGHPTAHLPHILNTSFPGVDTETLLMNLDLEGIAASGGSACTSGSLSVSHVMQAMHLPDNVQRSAVRFSFGHTQTISQIQLAAAKLATIVRRVRR